MNQLNSQMMESDDKQISLTDPDARSMATSGRAAGWSVTMCGAVDTRHLIVAHEVTNVGSDRDQLSDMTERARWRWIEVIEVVADRGYYKGEEIVACERAGNAVYLPKPMTSGLYAKTASVSRTSSMSRRTTSIFVPPVNSLTYHYTNEQDGKTLRRYWTTACEACALKNKCDRQGAPDLTLGALRGRPRGRAGAARPKP